LKAWVFSAIVALSFIAFTTLGVYLVHIGYGMPSEFFALYILDYSPLLAGISSQVGEPIVYEWLVTGLLKPGVTNITVSVWRYTPGDLDEQLKELSIQVDTGKGVVEAKGSSMSTVVYRDSSFLVIRVRIEIPPGFQLKSGSIHVSVDAVSYGR